AVRHRPWLRVGVEPLRSDIAQFKFQLQLISIFCFGALFTGYRWENRFRVLPREHWINPVLYLEFENINGADRSLLEVVNHDGKEDLAQPSGDSRAEKKRELEAKLILSSYFKGWTIAENFI